MKAVYKQLGKLESQDQITMAETLKLEYYTDDNKFTNIVKILILI